MVRFVLRKDYRFKKLVPVRYQGDGIAGEGIIEDLSLSGSYINGSAPVSVGMALALKIFVPGDSDPLLIEATTVKWVKGRYFGVEFDTPQSKKAERIETAVSALVKEGWSGWRQVSLS